MLDQWEPGELRGSRRVLRAAEGEVSSADSPVVFIPKYRKKAIFGQIRRELGEVLRRLAEQKESCIEEGHLLPDHVHMMSNYSYERGSPVDKNVSGRCQLWSCCSSASCG